MAMWGLSGSSMKGLPVFMITSCIWRRVGYTGVHSCQNYISGTLTICASIIHKFFLKKKKYCKDLHAKVFRSEVHQMSITHFEINNNKKKIVCSALFIKRLFIRNKYRGDSPLDISLYSFFLSWTGFIEPWGSGNLGFILCVAAFLTSLSTLALIAPLHALQKLLPFDVTKEQRNQSF